MRILQVSTADEGGGAESSARTLHEAYRAMGHESRLAVGRKHGSDADTVEIPNDAERPSWERLWSQLDRRSPVGGPARWAANPLRQAARALGLEDFSFPASANLGDLTSRPPEIIHCHNLHGAYFDLRAIATLTRRFPVLLDLRDEWLLTGHCAYSLGCERWAAECGNCPHLDTYPAIPRDATRFNWRRKRRILARSTVAISAPSKWLLERARRAMFRETPARVIPNGVDLSVFHPGECRQAARARLGLPTEDHIVLYTGHSPFKDVRTAERALARLAARPGRSLCFVQLGVDGPSAQLGLGRRLLAGFVRNPSTLSDYYRAADVFIHASLAESFGKTATEAMACGTPVVATAVGGLVEQIDDGRSGILTPPADPGAISFALERLLSDERLRARLGRAGAEDAARRFSLERQARDFLDWYKEVIAHWRASQPDRP